MEAAWQKSSLCSSAELPKVLHLVLRLELKLIFRKSFNYVLYAAVRTTAFQAQWSISSLTLFLASACYSDNITCIHNNSHFSGYNQSNSQDGYTQNNCSKQLFMTISFAQMERARSRGMINQVFRWACFRLSAARGVLFK